MKTSDVMIQKMSLKTCELARFSETTKNQSRKWREVAQIIRVQNLQEIPKLVNCPEISGTVPETNFVSCCPGSIQNCPANYSRGKHIFYSDRDRMLAC